MDIRLGREEAKQIRSIARQEIIRVLNNTLIDLTGKIQKEEDEEFKNG